MIDTASQYDIKALRTKIAELYSLFIGNGDTETADKAKQLFTKLQNQEYGIAFCGHFSAGKSSMINKIIGENLLPSSPIPTSANLVKIKTGEEYAKVIFKEGNPRLYPAPYNYEKVKSYCKDGDSIQTIEISHQSDKLPPNVCIMDTPGIDSTDDAHRIATESALHLADLVFYVMDYNHVQSEVNFLFTKELTEAGKEVYLVINQIDKHRDEELSFQDFKTSVKESFAAWGVQPAEIFYTSLKAEEHVHNKFSKLKQFIHGKLDERDALLPISVAHSFKKLTEEHERYLKEKDKESLEKCEEKLSEIPVESQELLPAKVEDIEKEITKISTLKKTKEKDFENGFEDILKSAYLMPFETRELAERFLESAQSNFKVGLLFSKQKTEQEKQERLERFLSDFQEKVNSQLTWHIKEFLNKILKIAEIQEPSILSKVQSLAILITKEMLKSVLKSGAQLSGDYVLNYTSDVAEVAKKAARKEITPIKEGILQIVHENSEEDRERLEKEKHQLDTLLHAWEWKQEILESQTGNLIRMEQVLTGHFEPSLHEDALEELVSEQDDIEIVHESDLEKETIEKEVPSFRMTEDVSKKTVGNSQDKAASVVKKLQFSAGKLHQIPGFKKISTLLSEKAERLEKRGFTVALFGAFSAGKSSFANSLIGEKLLPVSPNPTTAAINKIMPVDSENKHGLVNVQLKTAGVLLADVKRSLSVFDVHASNFDEALNQIKTVIDKLSNFDAHEKTHISFLNAFYKGFNAYRNQLGEIIQTDLVEFRDFVANEEKSCLVELIEVYYDCELTRKGITLVDTPGADSINARHTGVAFDYIKNSDAILFVTYYNHAFSKADREFLIQLGRVKDTFEMDKMFFVVNAVDLANNETEKQEVLGYVHDQLVQYGIRKPSLFPISSMLAIKEKLEGVTEFQSGISQFEKSFYSFITHDLIDISINAAMLEWERAIEQLRSFIHSANEDIEQKHAKVQQLKTERVEIKKLIQEQSSGILLQRLNQEIEELTYYIKQRVFLRFNDFFKEAFNPSVLRDDGRNLKKVLEHSLDEFLHDFGFDFAQEFRATSLRIEVFIGKLFHELHHSLTKSLSKVNHELSFSEGQLGKMDELSFANELANLDKNTFKKVLSLFKNPKSFFEKNEKRLMQEALNETLQFPTEAYMNAERDKLLSHYERELNKHFDALLNLLLEEAEEYYQGLFATLSNEIPVEQLVELEKELVNDELAKGFEQ
ncbi:dynamin family protein [Robertmurraya kyonggiensis]|uniref:GTP-binding protein n=1 Tax=Robertmurraya kyonggiensis TaxID=1037680 RepID=A0A4U1DAZ5_9BACI|nr:dynamin family protein [Robertmurraya kyonggiensis]TKC19654.1 GTP-binding protein [Robertmurraya kyonggiensis]